MLEVIKYSSTQCPPCRQIAREFANLIISFPSVRFQTVEGGRPSDIKYVPTIVFLKNGIEIARFVGSETMLEVEQKLEELTRTVHKTPAFIRGLDRVQLKFLLRSAAHVKDTKGRPTEELRQLLSEVLERNLKNADRELTTKEWLTTFLGLPAVLLIPLTMHNFLSNEADDSILTTYSPYLAFGVFTVLMHYLPPGGFSSITGLSKNQTLNFMRTLQWKAADESDQRPEYSEQTRAEYQRLYSRPCKSKSRFACGLKNETCEWRDGLCRVSASTKLMYKPGRV